MIIMIYIHDYDIFGYCSLGPMSQRVLYLCPAGAVTLPLLTAEKSWCAETSPIKDPIQRVATNPFSTRVKLRLENLMKNFECSFVVYDMI